MQCFLPDDDNSTASKSVFDLVWKQDLSVPLFLIVVLFPLINFKSPTFFTKLNALGQFCAFVCLFIIVKVLQKYTSRKLKTVRSTNACMTHRKLIMLATLSCKSPGKRRYNSV